MPAGPSDASYRRPGPLTGRAFYVPGDGYPADRGVQDQICARLRAHMPRLQTQDEWLGAGIATRDLEGRMGRLVRCIDGDPEAILIGRSSGARLATLVAARRRVRAVLCIASPFRAPGLALEAGRFAHLAELTVPTLILQGMVDPYGGADLTENYRLSPAVHVRLIPGLDHDFRVPDGAWDAIAAAMLGFIGRAVQPEAPERAVFDEVDYLRRNGDVANAVGAGGFASGHAHFLLHGRAEGRPYRLVASVLG